MYYNLRKEDEDEEKSKNFNIHKLCGPRTKKKMRVKERERERETHIWPNSFHDQPTKRPLDPAMCVCVNRPTSPTKKVNQLTMRTGFMRFTRIVLFSSNFYFSCVFFASQPVQHRVWPLIQFASNEMEFVTVNKEPAWPLIFSSFAPSALFFFSLFLFLSSARTLNCCTWVFAELGCRVWFLLCLLPLVPLITLFHG